MPLSKNETSSSSSDPDPEPVALAARASSSSCWPRHPRCSPSPSSPSSPSRWGRPAAAGSTLRLNELVRRMKHDTPAFDRARRSESATFSAMRRGLLAADTAARHAASQAAASTRSSSSARSCAGRGGCRAGCGAVAVLGRRARCGGATRVRRGAAWRGAVRRGAAWRGAARRGAVRRGAAPPRRVPPPPRGAPPARRPFSRAGDCEGTGSELPRPRRRAGRPQRPAMRTAGSRSPNQARAAAAPPPPRQGEG